MVEGHSTPPQQAGQRHGGEPREGGEHRGPQPETRMGGGVASASSRASKVRTAVNAGTGASIVSVALSSAPGSLLGHRVAPLPPPRRTARCRDAPRPCWPAGPTPIPGPHRRQRRGRGRGGAGCADGRARAERRRRARQPPARGRGRRTRRPGTASREWHRPRQRSSRPASGSGQWWRPDSSNAGHPSRSQRGCQRRSLAMRTSPRFPGRPRRRRRRTQRRPRQTLGWMTPSEALDQTLR